MACAQVGIGGAAPVDGACRANGVGRAQLDRQTRAGDVGRQAKFVGGSARSDGGTVGDEDLARRRSDQDAGDVLAGRTQTADLCVPGRRCVGQLDAGGPADRQPRLRIAGGEQAFGGLGADRVFLVRRQGHRREDADDRHDDYQLDQREAFLVWLAECLESVAVHRVHRVLRQVPKKGAEAPFWEDARALSGRPRERTWPAAGWPGWQP